MILDVALAFLAGLISWASTCVLPLVPAYIAYMGGQATLSGGRPSARQQARVLGKAALFVAGFSTAFVALGASFGLIGADLQAYRPVLLEVAGAALILMGFALLTLQRIPGLMSERRFDLAHRLPRAPWASYVIGLAFAIGWTPCVGPILAAILLRAGASGTAGQGAILLAAYSLGLGIPFMVAAGLSGMLTRLLTRVRGAYPAMNAIAAIFLIGMGFLIFSNRLTVFNSVFPFVSVTTPFDSHFQSDGPVATPPAQAHLKIGSAAPNFVLTDTDGHTISLAALKGKPVLINFWATWCGPCRDELPLIHDEYRAHQAEGLQVVAIDFGNESADTVRHFWQGLGLEPAPVLDPDGQASRAFGIMLKNGLPVSVLIGRDGRVSSYEPFPLTRDFLDPALGKVL
ncbi:MAG TPA: cytochrome c biogenesis protein/redoxin [Candidatus Dormibacteraeota bacterium]